MINDRQIHKSTKKQHLIITSLVLEYGKLHCFYYRPTKSRSKINILVCTFLISRYIGNNEIADLSADVFFNLNYLQEL